jgi:dethiobiotin synthetase
MHRPHRLLAVLGTHTEVGKTWVGARLLKAARQRGLRVAARKPVQSFDPLVDSPSDAELLAEASGEQPYDVCSQQRCYELAMAPPMAADCLGRTRIGARELLAELAWPAQVDLGLVESVGGPRSPLTHDADSVEFVQLVQADSLLLVADAGLGSLNAIRLSLACLPAVPVAVLLNRFDARASLHQLNRTWLHDQYGIATFTEIDTLLTHVITL